MCLLSDREPDEYGGVPKGMGEYYGTQTVGHEPIEPSPHHATGEGSHEQHKVHGCPVYGCIYKCSEQEGASRPIVCRERLLNVSAPK